MPKQLKIEVIKSQYVKDNYNMCLKRDFNGNFARSSITLCDTNTADKF